MSYVETIHGLTPESVERRSTIRALTRMITVPSGTMMTVSEALNAAYSPSNLTKPKLAVKKIVEKPWVRRAKHIQRTKGKGVNKLRKKLMTIDAVDKTIHFKPDVPPKVGLRLEHTMDSPIIKLTNQKYMNTLAEKIKEDEKRVFNARTVERSKGEVRRRRQLVINGHAQPGPGEQDLLRHPLLKCKQVINRVSKKLEVQLGPVTRKPPKIVEELPFEEYERTGILFGYHKQHYLRTKPKRAEFAATGHRDYSEATISRLPTSLEHTRKKKGTKKVEETKNKSIEVLLPPTASNWIEELDSAEEVDEEIEELDIKNPEWHPDVKTHSDELIEVNDDMKVQETGGSGDSKETTAMNAKLLDEFSNILEFTELDKLYRNARSQLVNNVFEQESAEALFSVGTSVIKAYQREQLKTNDFCNKILRTYLMEH